MIIEAPLDSQELQFPAMGTNVTVLISARAAGGITPAGRPAAIAAAAEARVHELEAMWSRFQYTSEVSELNRSAGSAVRVSHETIRLFERAIEGWRMTDGAFDPSVLSAVVGSGYDRDFIAIGPAPWAPTVASASPGCSEIVVDPEAGLVQLPFGVGFDPGGIGKGLAADIVAEEAMAAGAAGAMVNIGGDIRVLGRAPDGHPGWVLAVAAELRTRLAFSEGAVATSTDQRRRWKVIDGATEGERHHLIDPSTGLPTTNVVRQVTVLTAAGWRAETVSKMLYVQWRPDRVNELNTKLSQLKARALVVTSDETGSVTHHHLGGIKDFIENDTQS
jgi:FAD:protein FMN transferase